MAISKVGLLAYGESASAALNSLAKKFNVKWIITQREEESVNRDVENLAKSLGVKIVHTNTEDEIIKAVKNEKLDIVVISSYNKALSSNLLNLTRFLNIHHGALPKWRGRANINWAIINNKKKVGLTFHEAIPEIDAGNIYSQFIVPIAFDDTVKTVYEKINIVIEKNLAQIVTKVLAGNKGYPQKGIPTYCCTRLPIDGSIDWSQKSKDIYNLIRGLTKPYPGAFTFFEGKRMIIWNAEIPKKPRKYEGRVPGRIAMIHNNYGVEVLTGNSSIIIKNINYNGREKNSSKVIRSVKKTLGINLVELYELLQQYSKSK